MLDKEYFYELFSLKLDVIEGPEIVFADENNNEVSHQSIGAGIIEVLIMLTHFIATENHIFIIDEPELHLHLHAKRMMASLLKKSSLKNQILCITHPTHFIFPKEIRNITLVRKIKGESKIFRLTGLPDGTQYEMATNKLSTILPRVIRADQKEFFFARSVLLVEGDTEYGAMPILSSKMRSEFDNYGVSIISMDGNNFAGFVLLLRAFEIPYLVMSDRDTLANIFTSIKVQGQDIRTSALIQQLDILGLISEDKEAVKENKDQIVREKEGKLAYNEQGVERLNAIVARKKDFVILSSDFEGVFKNAGYSKLFEEAENKYRKSKVLQGLYIAERVNQIPEEIEKIIHYIIERSK
jgi:predicted ATP-dependent endonuclease of OLD family